MRTGLIFAAATGAVLVMASGCRQVQPKYVEFQRPVPAVTTTFTNRIDPSWLRPSTNLFTLGPGDKLEIELLDDPASKTTTVVGPDGKIYFYLLPGLDVWGLTLDQATTLMEHQLAKYIRAPVRLNLTLRNVQSKRVWLLGRFQAPGVYVMAEPMTLLEAITMAGGPLTFSGIQQLNGGPLGEDLADLRHSFVIRDGALLPVDLYRLIKRGDLSQNIYLQPDDFVYFAPAYTREVYVLGAVTQAKAVPYTDGMTLAAAIAGAYGTVRDAYLAKVAIVRGSVSQPSVAVVNYYDIVKGRKPDVALDPDDIVFVPFSPYRYLRKYAEIALNTFVSSVAINAGVRAAAPPNTVGAGVFIPVGSGVQIIPPSAPPIH
jgi:polysaccharide biosynthesis/export protein